MIHVSRPIHHHHHHGYHLLALLSHFYLSNVHIIIFISLITCSVTHTHPIHMASASIQGITRSNPLCRLSFFDISALLLFFTSRWIKGHSVLDPTLLKGVCSGLSATGITILYFVTAFCMLLSFLPGHFDPIAGQECFSPQRLQFNIHYESRNERLSY